MNKNGLEIKGRFRWHPEERIFACEQPRAASGA